MKIHEWKRNELNRLLMEKFGQGTAPTDEESADMYEKKTVELAEEEEEIEERHKPDNINQGRDSARSTKKLSTGERLRETAEEDDNLEEGELPPGLKAYQDKKKGAEGEKKDEPEGEEEEELEERHKPDNINQGRSPGRSTKKLSTGQRLREDTLRNIIKNVITRINEYDDTESD